MWLSVNFENFIIAQLFDGHWLAMICDWCVREEHMMVRKKRNDDRETPYVINLIKCLWFKNARTLATNEQWTNEWREKK